MAKSLNIKHSGTWKQPTKVSVKQSGAWKEVITGSIKDGGTWKPFYQRVFTYTVSTDVNKLDLDTVLTADNKLGDVNVVINSGIYVYSDTPATPALLTGSGVAGVLTITNNGYIIGGGGTGGTGGAPTGSRTGGAGNTGGTALKLEKNITLDDNGSILGGGGGGGGGGGAEADQPFSDDDFAGGGGGGGGQSFGVGGARNPTCSGSSCDQASTNGGAGTKTARGAGGLGANVDGDARAGNGGAGGLAGASGSAGDAGYEGDEGTGSGGGGAGPGPDIDNNGFTRTDI